VIKRVGTDETVFDQNVGNATTYNYTGAHGDNLYAFVLPISAAEIEGIASNASASVELIDPTDDEDGDGQNNSDEETAGTDLFDSSSKFEIASQTIETNGDVTITWIPVSGKTYTIQSRVDLVAGDWVNDVTGQTSGSNTYTPTEGEDKKFYRVVVE
jgi:hypothetical protein